MGNEKIISEIVKRYRDSQEQDRSSVHYGLSRERSIISIEIGNEEHGISRQALADAPDVGDELADAIWSWVHP